MNWYKKARKERIPGGKAEGHNPEEYPKDQIKDGIKVEKEHSPDDEVAKEISLDHLQEFSNYYTGLAEMEDKLKKQKNNKPKVRD